MTVDVAEEMEAQYGFPMYTGMQGKGSPERWRELPQPRRERLTRPEDYLPGPGLVDAVNVALLLGQPLLLTGEPGSGKTQLAYSLAYELGLYPPLKFETKSTTAARDLFYTYDALGRFQAGAAGGDRRAFLTFNALGTAILRARDGSSGALSFLLADDGEAPRRSVVLIDEVDKAPRDVPNDILNEIDGMYFRIPELDNIEIRADPGMRPIVVMTSNSEKVLPDAFLRRCIFYHIPFPDQVALRAIALRRLGLNVDGGVLLEEALDLFAWVRDPRAPFRKRPGTAELLDWLWVLRRRSAALDRPLRVQSALLEACYYTLFKSPEDQQQGRLIVERWRAAAAERAA